MDVQTTRGVKIVRLVVPKGSDPPYAIDDSKIYVRSESETSMAVRDEIVNLVLREYQPPSLPTEVKVEMEGETSGRVEPPRTGVEIVDTQERKGTRYHTMRDLRNGNVVQNVTRKSARRLWHYAISQAEDHPVDPNAVEWHGDIGLLDRREHAGQLRYNLVQRDGDRLRVYYGVTEDGIHGEWAKLVGMEENEQA